MESPNDFRKFLQDTLLQRHLPITLNEARGGEAGKGAVETARGPVRRQGRSEDPRRDGGSEAWERKERRTWRLKTAFILLTTNYLPIAAPSLPLISFA